MAANKVAINGKTILDLTQDTVTPATLAKGATAHDKSGAQLRAPWKQVLAGITTSQPPRMPMEPKTWPLQMQLVGVVGEVVFSG